MYFKEPNDIYVNDQKICGILIETQAESKVFDYLIIGIGLNVNQLEFAQSNATSLGLILKQKSEIKVVLNELIHILLEGYEKNK